MYSIQKAVLINTLEGGLKVQLWKNDFNRFVGKIGFAPSAYYITTNELLPNHQHINWGIFYGHSFQLNDQQYHYIEAGVSYKRFLGVIDNEVKGVASLGLYVSPKVLMVLGIEQEFKIPNTEILPILPNDNFLKLLSPTLNQNITSSIHKPSAKFNVQLGYSISNDKQIFLKYFSLFSQQDNGEPNSLIMIELTKRF